MRSINIHEAKTHLSRLVEEAANGDPFIIAKAGRPVARVVPLEPEPEPRKPQRIGFLKGHGTCPEDRAAFKAIAADEIALILGDDDE
jgi:prevent-host-death family protein